MQWIVAQQVPADLRAAMLRSLDDMNGIDGALMGVDLLGRQGVVLSHLDIPSGLREQYVLAQDGGRLLERRSFTTSSVDPACPPGTFTEYSLYDDLGRAVSPANAPVLDWPQVVTACAPR
jgi:hypothetical protein